MKRSCVTLEGHDMQPHGADIGHLDLITILHYIIYSYVECTKLIIEHMCMMLQTREMPAEWHTGAYLRELNEASSE